MRATGKFPVLIICSLLIFSFSLSRCGKAPSDVPLPLTGAIRIAAHIDSTLVDSMVVILDNISRGKMPNGCIIGDIEAGKHLVAVSRDDPESPIDFSCSPRLVMVKANETTKVNFALTKIAPNFILKNLQDQERSLTEYQGRVVHLVFFSLG